MYTVCRDICVAKSTTGEIQPAKSNLAYGHTIYIPSQKRLLSSHNVYSFPTPRNAPKKVFLKQLPVTLRKRFV
jgi:hypothetical protein